MVDQSGRDGGDELFAPEERDRVSRDSYDANPFHGQAPAAGRAHRALSRCAGAGRAGPGRA